MEFGAEYTFSSPEQFWSGKSLSCARPLKTQDPLAALVREEAVSGAARRKEAQRDSNNTEEADN
jgi:hypothetical protein